MPPFEFQLQREGNLKEKKEEGRWPVLLMKSAFSVVLAARSFSFASALARFSSAILRAAANLLAYRSCARDFILSALTYMRIEVFFTLNLFCT